MEPLDPLPGGSTLPPPVWIGAPQPTAPTMGPFPNAPTSLPASTSAPTAVTAVSIRSMAPWRIAGAVALVLAFALLGAQVRRLIDDQPWSDVLMWAAAGAGLAVAGCVLVWTWVATDNARRLVGPATNRPLPDPGAAVAAWALPFLFVAVAVGVVAYLGSHVDPGADDSVAAIPLAVATAALLLAIPLTYRPLNVLAGVVRQVGGHSSQLARWMWVPVVLAVTGVATLIALRLGTDEPATGDVGWAPLWMVAVVAITPCVIVVALAWRASGAVEEAITVAAGRRRERPAAAGTGQGRSVTIRAQLDRDARAPIRLLPGADLLRLCIVTLLAGLALLSVVGAAVMLMFWLEADAAGLTPGQRTRAWDAVDSLHDASRVVAFVLIGVVTVWTALVVYNARRAASRAVSPSLVIAAAWPAAGFGVWFVADRMIVDQSIARVLAGFALQAVVLAVPFQLLERTADLVGARRTPLRITYVFGVVLLVHVQGLGGLSTIEETGETASIGRLAGYLALGALVQLMSTMAVTEACRALSTASEHEAEHHNMLAAQQLSRAAAAGPAAPAAP